MFTEQRLMELGLSEENAKKVIGEYKNFIPKERFDQVNEKLKDAKAELAEAHKTLGTLEKEKGELQKTLQAKEGDPGALESLQNDLKAKAGEITELKKAHEAEMNALRMDQAIAAQLNDAQDINLVLGLINKESLTLAKDGGVDGLDDQLKSLREEKAFLFKADEPNRGFGMNRGKRVDASERAAEAQADGYLKRYNEAQNLAERVQIKQEAHANGIEIL